MMSKQTRTIIITLAALLILIAALLVISLPAMRAGRRAQDDMTLTFTCAGETVAVLTAEEIYALPSETFEATIRSGGERPTPARYTGVEIHELLSAAGADAQGASALLFKGADLYLTTVEAEELGETGNIYIVYARDGEPMKSRSGGGDGPYQVVVLDDYYSLRWCKYLSEVELVE